MELPEELLLAIAEHLQPARYEDEAALRLDYYARQRAAHSSTATVKMVSRGFQSLMTRTARVVRANAYRSYAEFATQTHRHAEHFEANADWVDDDALRSLPKVMPRLRAVGLYGSSCRGASSYGVSLAVKALLESTELRSYHQNFYIDYSLDDMNVFSPLENHPTLRHLSLRFVVNTCPELPECLPKLETLSIEVGPDCFFNWDSALPFCPSLRKLTIRDTRGDELDEPSIFEALTPRTLHQLMAELPSLQSCHVTRVSSVVLHACSTFHNGERIICYRAPPGVSLTFGPEAFPRGVRVVLDVDTAPLPLAVAVWDLQTITDWDATAVPLGYV